MANSEAPAKIQLRSSPALLIVDMQNGFCHPSGTFGKLGMDISNHVAVIPAIQRLRSLAHRHGIPVIFTRIGFAADYSDSGLIGETIPAIKDLKGFVRGTWDAAIVDDLSPDPETETVIDKTRNTAFWGTTLAKTLRELGTDQLIVAGVGTNVCVESTVRDAFTEGFRVLVVEDATATLTAEEHVSSLRSMRWFGEVGTVGDIGAALGGKPVSS